MDKSLLLILPAPASPGNVPSPTNYTTSYPFGATLLFSVNIGGEKRHLEKAYGGPSETIAF